MRRGFVLTLLTFVLFMILIDVTVQLRTERARVSSWTQSMIVDRKMLYATDDIAEEVRNTFGVRIEREEVGATLYIYDSLPAAYPIDSGLRGYSDFVSQKYATSDVSIAYYDANLNQMQLESMPPQFVMNPYNLTYGYGDYWKMSLNISCSGGACNRSDVDSVAFAYNFTTANFTWVPTAGNQTYYRWSPDSMLGGCSGDPKCINFTLKLTDSRGSTFTCPSSMCNYTQFPSDRGSVLDVQMSPCWFEIRLGDDNIISIRLHQPDSAELCNTSLVASTSLNVSSAYYWVDLPGSVGVTDLNYNFSRTLTFPGENVSTRQLLMEIPPSHRSVESYCFSANPNIWAGGSSNHYVYGLRIANTCPSQRITITNMTVSWTPKTGSDRIEIININGTNVWVYNGVGTPDGRQPSGTKLDILDYTLDPLLTKNISYFRFYQSMLGKTLNVSFVFGDNSTAWTSGST